MVPVQVSVPVMIPNLVSFTADAVGITISPINVESKKNATNNMLLCDVVFFKIDTSIPSP
jgi:hypothetical protein